MTHSQGRPARLPPVFADAGNAEPRDQFRVLARGDFAEANLRDIAQRAGDRLHVFLAQNVAHAHAKLLIVLETVQNQFDVFRRAAKFGERVFEPFAVGQFVEHEAVHQAVDHAGIARQNAR